MSRRNSADSRLEGRITGRANVSQLVAFVDTQDPNSRSTIQRHTAHHTNARRRDARLRSLRTSRPRLEWQRRPSTDTEVASLASSQDSTASTAPPSAPTLRKNVSAPGSISTEVTKGEDTNFESTILLSLPTRPSADSPLLSDRLVEDYLLHLCPFADKGNVQRVIKYIEDGDSCSKTLLFAVMLLSINLSSTENRGRAEDEETQQLYGKGTRLLRERLTDPEAASSDENMQAVLLLIAYAADTGSDSEVPIHLEALSRMVKERGGLEAIAPNMNPVLMMQITAVPRSRHYHLTLGCRSECLHKLRFLPGTDNFSTELYESASANIKISWRTNS